jgi:hypothetical protein
MVSTAYAGYINFKEVRYREMSKINDFLDEAEAVV